MRDLDTIQQELCKKDLQYLAAAVAQEEKDVKKSQGMKISALFRTTMDKVKELLEANKPVRDGEFAGPEVEMINLKLGNLLTTKPMICELLSVVYLRFNLSPFAPYVLSFHSMGLN